jgi:Fic family protein
MFHMKGAILKIIKLALPNLDQINKKKVIELLFSGDSKIIQMAIHKSMSPKYLFWDKAKYLKATPLSAEELWFAIKITRKSSAFPLPIKTPNKDTFYWAKAYETEKILHEIDLNTGGSLKGNYAEYTQDEKYKFISRGIIEEAIASSQLEGANTTRKYAKRLIREGIKPRTKAENMIINNYTAMKNIEEHYQNKKLSIELLFEMHEEITKNTIPENDLGRLRKDTDEIVILDNDQTIAFEPPKEVFLKKELKEFIAFCNNETKHSFIHPVIKSIIIHFWFAYLHPFVDGNGRMARLLFYWFLIKNGYWAFSYLPISTIIKKSHRSYEKSFIYSEQDDNDLTYFIDYNLSKIELAMKEFQEYVNIKANESKSLNRLNKFRFNSRQKNLLHYFLGDADARTTVKTHMNLNAVSRRTAESDLKILVEKKILRTEKLGKFLYYYPIEDLKDKLQ